MIHYIGETLVMEFGHGTLLAISGEALSDEGKVRVVAFSEGKTVGEWAFGERFKFGDSHAVLVFPTKKSIARFIEQLNGMLDEWENGDD